MKKRLISFYIAVLAMATVGCNNPKKNIGKMYIKIGIPYIASVDKNSSAQISGLRPGDRIIEINEKKIKRVADISEISKNFKGKIANLTCKRGLMTFDVTLRNGLAGIFFQYQKYSSTLGFVIYDISNAINRKLPYDYSAALAGDIFSPCVNENKCVKEWNSALGEQNLSFIGKALGVKFEEIYTYVSNSNIKKDSIIKAYKNTLSSIEEYIGCGKVIIIHGGFYSPFTWNWGIADSISHDTLFAFTVGGGGERLPVTEAPQSIYLLRYTGTALPMDSINYHIIKKIIGLYKDNNTIYGWKTGFQAYKFLEGINNYDKFSRYMLKEQYYEQFWNILKLNRESENAFIYFSGLAKRKELKKYLQHIMEINNIIIKSRTPSYIDVQNNLNCYIEYVKKIARLDSLRIDLYEKTLMLY